MFHGEQNSEINSLTRGIMQNLLTRLNKNVLQSPFPPNLRMHHLSQMSSFVLIITAGLNIWEKIVLCHWIILLHNPKLKSVIALKPQFVYKRAPIIKNIIASSKLQEVSKPSMYPLAIFCNHCQKMFNDSSEKEHSIHKSLTCLSCPWASFRLTKPSIELEQNLVTQNVD